MTETQDGIQNHTENNWILVIWPENTDTGEQLLNQYLTSSSIIKNIDISSQFYIGFPRSNTSNVTSTVIARSANQLFEFFEVYGINGKLIVTQISEVGHAFMNCLSCPSQTNRRSNFQGVLLKVEGLV